MEFIVIEKKILWTPGQKEKVTYEGKKLDNIQACRQQHFMPEELRFKERKFEPRISYPAKPVFKCKGIKELSKLNELRNIFLIISS